MLAACSNVAGAVSYSIGTLLTGVWDVSNEGFAKGNFTGMWKLTLLTRYASPTRDCPLYARDGLLCYVLTHVDLQ